jgi:hypothetical protein
MNELARHHLVGVDCADRISVELLPGLRGSRGNKVAAQQQVSTSIGDMSRADIRRVRCEDDVAGHGPTLLRKASHIQHRTAHSGNAGRLDLPRPMKGRDGADFSFSGLKTRVRQTIEGLPPITTI